MQIFSEINVRWGRGPELLDLVAVSSWASSLIMVLLTVSLVNSLKRLGLTTSCYYDCTIYWSASIEVRKPYLARSQDNKLREVCMPCLPSCTALHLLGNRDCRRLNISMWQQGHQNKDRKQTVCPILLTVCTLQIHVAKGTGQVLSQDSKPITKQHFNNLGNKFY